MRKYLSTLHTKPEHHKKRFALAVSGLTTLLIFAVWAAANFGVGGQVVATTDKTKTNTEVGPLESLRMSMAASYESFKQNFSELKHNLDSVDLKTEYNQMKSGAEDFYGR